MHEMKTHCARMDHGGCSLIVTLDGGVITRIRGDKDGFLNEGYLCPKGALSAEKLTDPDRLRYPLKRLGKRGGGRWQRIDWEEALSEIADRLNEEKERNGARSVAFCLGMPKGLEHFVLIRLANLFGSPNVVAHQDVCHAPREITGVHTCGFYPVADFHHESKLIVLWGSNISATNEEGEISSLVKKQISRGARCMVVDPRKIDMVHDAEMWLPLRPGSDALLALSFLNVIIEENLYDHEFVANWTYGFADLVAHVKQFSPEAVSGRTWLAPDDIRRAARIYAEEKPAVIQWGNPVEHTVNAFSAARALVCLMAVCGNLDIPGGNVRAVEPPIMSLRDFVRADSLPDKRKKMIGAHHGVIPRFMTVPPAFFRTAVLEGEPYPVRAAYVMCTNPLVTYADTPRTYAAFMDLDFCAVADIAMTPTAGLADIVLPAATQYECDDIGHYGLGHGYILARPQLVDPPAECRPDCAILNELGRRLSPPEYWYDDYRELLDEVLAPAGIDFREFVEKGFLKGDEHFRHYENRGFRTATGKVELLLSTAEKYGLSPLPCFDSFPGEPDDEFPLILTSAKSPNYLHSSYRWVDALRAREPDPVVYLHPETASRLGVAGGDTVVIETRHGAITQHLETSDDVHPRVAVAAIGWWFPEQTLTDPETWQRSNFNMLTSVTSLGREFGTPNLKGIPCRIRRDR